jgi:hypothetical protein
VLEARYDTTCVLGANAELYCWGGLDAGTPWKIPGPWEGGRDDCDGIDQAVAAEVLALRQEPLPYELCQKDSDCTEVDFGVSCRPGCASAPLHVSLADDMATELARIDDTYCDAAEELGCYLERVECPAEAGTLACVAGSCVRFDADATGCEDACACTLLEQLANSAPQVEPQCEGHHLMLQGFVPCSSCSSSRLYFAVSNYGQQTFEGEVKIELEASTDLDLPEPMSVTLSLEPGTHSEPLYFEFSTGSASAVARIVVDDNCTYMSEWSDFPIEIPAIPVCP